MMAVLQWILLHLSTSEASRKDLHIANKGGGVRVAHIMRVGRVKSQSGRCIWGGSVTLNAFCS